MIPLLKVHEYYRVENVVNNDRLEKRIVNNNRLEKLEELFYDNIIEKHYSLRRNRYGYPRSNEKV